MSTKTKLIYVCQECGARSSKWVGQCADCKAWNSIVEEVMVDAPSGGTGVSARFGSYAAETSVTITTLSEIDLAAAPRIGTQVSELDRVLGGGLVVGSAVLVGGDPGIGKSTLLLQALCNLSEKCKTLYVTGEESLQQIAMRAARLGLAHHRLQLLAETQVERIIALAQSAMPQVIVIDSIQTLYSEVLQSAPGGVGQVRECAARLVRYAKQNNVSLFVIGHSTKEGTIAGPRVLEHMVDCVLYFEGESDSRYRVIRATKNRFGAVNELGVFAMTDGGLREVNNPSAIFLSSYSNKVAGSAVMVTWEGSRPLLVEVQALVDASYLANPRRVAVGLDQNRLSMLLAVLHRHGGVKTYDQDVFVNVVGGVRVTETAIDLAILLAIISSLRNRPLPEGLVVFGEVGLAGEIRPVQSGQERIKAAAKHGFTRALVPQANAPKKAFDGIESIGVSNLYEAVQVCSNR
jgi:DNA repair protein RadA/Sms